MLHHQGIAFNTDGELVDGQHRLTMVVKTGLATVLWVTRNVPIASVIHMDEQAVRSTKDAIKMAGEGDYSHSVVAVAKALYDYPRSDAWVPRPSKTVVLGRLHLWAKNLDFAESRLRGPGLSRAVRVLVARAHAVVGEEAVQRLSEWCEVLSTGMPVSADYQLDSAGIRFRNLLLSKSGIQGATVEVEKYRKGQTALHAFLSRTPMSKIYGTETDLYPVPKERQETPVEEEVGV